ncbi:hypothetical protein HZB74_02385 [Candidatus Saccharibacteria bacterium]|nr:hypothetical protein [Candidatus Saccharibacteria bacterium]
MRELDFNKELVAIEQTIELPEYVLRPETLRICGEALQEINDRYGIESDSPRPYHWFPHSLDVIKREVRLTNILKEYMNPEDLFMIYDLLFMIGATHDIEQNEAPGLNERMSTDRGIELLSSCTDPILKSELFISMYEEGGMVTEVEFGKDGRIEQPNLHKGSRAKSKFVAAFADINAIAMEGPERMILDATNIYFELDKNPTISGYHDFLFSQIAFLRRRLNDWRITSDISRYFPENTDEVYDALEENFHDNIVSAYDMAKKIPDTPGINTELGYIIRKSTPFTAGRLAVERLLPLAA